MWTSTTNPQQWSGQAKTPTWCLSGQRWGRSFWPGARRWNEPLILGGHEMHAKANISKLYFAFCVPIDNFDPNYSFHEMGVGSKITDVKSHQNSSSRLFKQNIAQIVTKISWRFIETGSETTLNFRGNHEYVWRTIATRGSFLAWHLCTVDSVEEFGNLAKTDPWPTRPPSSFTKCKVLSLITQRFGESKLRANYFAKCCGHPSLEVDDGGDAAIVVVDVDGAHHLLALQVPDAQPNPADGVAPAQFHQLRAARIPMSKISIQLTTDKCYLRTELCIRLRDFSDPDPIIVMDQDPDLTFLKWKSLWFLQYFFKMVQFVFDYKAY